MKFILIIIAIATARIIYWILFLRNNSNKIAQLTDEWINLVTIENDPDKISRLFCKNATLVGTVSQKIRTGADIKSYFDYFANLSGICVISKQYTIKKISPRIYVNTAFIEWFWDGLSEPIIARMTFIFKGNCIVYLHSSALPDINEKLIEISGKN